MSKLFSKHLHLCFFKLKYPTIPQSPPHPQQHHHHTESPPPPSSTCHFEKSSSFTHSRKDSLHDAASSSAHSTFKSTDEDLFSSSSGSDTCELPPDLPSMISSSRFFFSSPGRSNSIIEYTRPSNSYNNNNKKDSKSLIPKGGVGVTKHSVDPYVDFRRSMQEMIDSRELVDVRKDWEYLHELLLCYLALNHPHTHKYVVRAFTDLVVDLLSSSSEASRRRKHKNRRQISLSGPLL